MQKIPHPTDENLLVGLHTADDAGVYKLTADIALIHTVDFFTPIVDDPYMYGQIAAANSLSDVYAMGGRPLTALNIVGFPQILFSNDILAEILKGGYDKVTEAGALIVGGHTITDDELKYGLAVTGIVHPDKVLTNAGARAGDVLILTKPIGTGILTTALKGEYQLGTLLDQVSQMMARLNNIAMEVMQKFTVNACTDISGFGLLGHSHEVAKSSRVGLQFQLSQIPHYREALPLIKKGFVPGGAGNNRIFLDDKVLLSENLSWEQSTLLFDPQTSGGLLIAVPADHAEQFLQALHSAGVPEAAIVGRVVAEHPGQIEVVD